MDSSLIFNDKKIKLSEEDSVLIMRGDGTIQACPAIESSQVDDNTGETMFDLYESAWMLFAVIDFINDKDAITKRLAKLESKM